MHRDPFRETASRTGRIRPAALVLACLAGAVALAPVAIAGPTELADLASARQFQALERWAPSESLATAALARLEAEPAADSLAIADALHLVAVARWRTVGYAEGAGQRAATRALGIRERRLGAEHLEVAESHALLGRFLLGTDRADSALAHVRRALDVRAKLVAADDTLLARTWDQLALVERQRRDFRASLDAWDRAIAIRRRAHGPEHPEVARLLAQTGVPWMELGDLERARAVLEESLRMFARTSGPDDVRRWTPLNILADVESRFGNHARNIDLLQEALRLVRAAHGNDSREALTLRTNLALALGLVDDYAGSMVINTALLPACEAQYGPAHPRTLLVRHGLAQASRAAGDTATALRQLREIESALLARSGPPDPNLSTVLAQQAELLDRQGRFFEARVLAERAIRSAQSSRSPKSETLVHGYSVLIPTLEATGDLAALDSARRELIRIDEAPGSGQRNPGAIAYHVARAARRLPGHGDEAWSRALDAEHVSREFQQLNLRRLPDRRALLLAYGETRYLDFVQELSRGGDAARRATAWDRAVRTRALVRTEVERRRLPAGLAADSVVTGAHGYWLAAQRRLASQLVRSGVAPRDSAGRAQLQSLRSAADDAEGTYARALADRRAAQVPAAEVGLAEVRARLRPGQALVGCLEFTDASVRAFSPARSDSGHLIAYVARAGDGPIERIELGPTGPLRATLEAWRAELARSPGPRARAGNRAERACRRLGDAARALTWDRLAPHLGDVAEVFLVPDGVLVDLPWQAFPVGTSGYLVESGPRLHILNAERELLEPAAAGSGSLLAVGAPDFERAGEAPAPLLAASLVRSAPDPCADATRSLLAPLPGADAEVDIVARAWRGEAIVLRGAEATEAEFKARAPGREVIHLATHGVVAGDRCAAGAPGARGVGGVEPIVPVTARRRPPAPVSPWMPRRVWLALAAANRAAEHRADENEGLLTAEEVLTLDLSDTDWVVLSACHSGLAEAWSREGALGMRRAFDLAGARTVIASQWAVEDEATREWMQALYGARAGGATSAGAAVEAASRATLAARRHSGRTTHPFCWAAFTASGR